MKSKLDIHQSITDSIVAAIEAGAGDCVMPWHRTGLAGLLPKNASSGNAYNGINVVSLWAAAQDRGYSHALWGTYKQWQGLGAQVRGGEKAAPIVFYKQFEVEPNHEDDSDDGTRRVARASWVSMSRRSTASHPRQTPCRSSHRSNGMPGPMPSSRQPALTSGMAATWPTTGLPQIIFKCRTSGGSAIQTPA